MNKITYIFSGGRINKVGNSEYAQEFFYGYSYLKDRYSNVSIIEFNNNESILKKFEYVISKLFSLPLYIFSIISKKNLQSIRETNNLILVSESAGFAALIPLIFLKRKYNIKTYMFVMGLYSKKINYKALTFFHNSFVSLLIKYLDKLYFLGNEEYKIAINSLEKHDKIVFKPFNIDCEFWKTSKLKIEENNQILFIGNDGNRDFDLLLNIAKIMPDKNFIIVSSNNQVLETKLSNVNVISGSWKEGFLSDLDLKKIYEKSRLVILPLKDSAQPSGQSVALQSMSMGIPVLISKTKGFWDIENFVENENIFFELSRNPNLWSEKINNLYDNTTLLKKVAQEASLLVRKQYNIKEFHNYLEEELIY